MSNTYAESSDTHMLAARSKRAKRIRTITANTIAYVCLCLVGFTMVIPFLWMLSTSLKQTWEVFITPPRWLPETLRWANYKDAATLIPFARCYFNSVFVAGSTTVGQVLTSAMAAYAFSRLTFRGREQLFLGYLATMMVPGSVTMIPVFVLAKYMGLVDTYQGLILPGIFSAYGTFMLRQFFMSQHRELEEAARIDGCSLYGIFRLITMPLAKPALATLTTFTFMGSWGAFTWPLIITYSEDVRTLPIAMAMFKGLYVTDYNLLMAASVVTVVPVLLVFVFGQRYFVEGIQLGAIKG